MSTPVIVLRNLQKVYRSEAQEVHAVRGVDLQIARGDYVAIMGSSGSGKSTMMNILGCLDYPSGGTYLLDGVDTSGLDADELSDLRNRKLGFVFQGFNLLARTTSVENVELPLIYSTSHLSLDERHDAAEAELERVGLGERMDHFPNQLSGGQQQRVAIARSLVNKPAVLLADEPTGNLDSATSEEIMKLFHALNDAGITIIMVTHEPDIAAHARRTIVMRDGEIRSDVRRLPPAIAPETADQSGSRSFFGFLHLLANIFSTSARALLRNKMRTVLTALGIIIGVAAVIAMVAIGRGVSAQTEAQFRAMGDNTLVVFSGQVFKGGIFRGGYRGSGTMTVDDVVAMSSGISGVVAVSPEARSYERLSAEGNNYQGNVKGVSPDYFIVRDWPFAAGVPFGDEEVDTMDAKAVIGQTIATRLFPDMDPLGRTVRIGGLPFVVTGLLAKKGSAPWGEDQDEVVFIPYTTSMKRVIGTRFVQSVSVKCATRADLPIAQEQINLLLRDRHNIRNPDEDDFSVGTQDEFIRMATETSRQMTLFIASIAGISLLVGGIGIMNIMLVSVTERTREIGIRRAVGARGRDIQVQFLVEAIVLSSVGGALGVALGVIVARMVPGWFGWPEAQVSAASIAVAFGVSFAVGVIFGFFPAFKAARLNPIDALRHE